MPQDYTVIVTVSGESQGAAFRFIADAIETAVEHHEDLAPEGIRVSTPDGTESVEL